MIATARRDDQSVSGGSRPAVLIVHNRYLERGGEDAVFEAEAALLEAHGHRVSRLVFDNRDLPAEPSSLQALQLAVDTVWSRRARSRLGAAIETFHPDVVHFHNTLPQVSPAAYAVCREAGAAVVQTLHNYRLACPSGVLFRDGQPCEECLGRRLALPALAHACYRGSRPQTAVVATMLGLHKALGTWQREVDLYIAPSRFLAAKLVEAGLPAERVVVKPNFVADDGVQPKAGEYALFVGRLAVEKGIETLLASYQEDAALPSLHVVGDGPLASLVTEAAATDYRITYRGRLERAGVLAEMAGAACLVFPSLWYENFPVTIAEAFACGLPVVASRLGAMAELVEEGRTGLLFRPGDSGDLASKLHQATSSPQQLQSMGQMARLTYLVQYTPERNYEALSECYALARRSLAGV